MKRLLSLVTVAAAIVATWAVREPSGRAEIIDETTPVPAVGAPGGPSRPLTQAELSFWIEGRRLFDHDFLLDEGLGTPDFNADSCRGCHQFPAIGGHGGLDVNVSRFGDDGFGTQPFQDLPGGQVASKLRRPDFPGRDEYPNPGATVFEQRQTPSTFGLGLIDGIFEIEILNGQDPGDMNGDGIFGVARMIGIGTTGLHEVGRFGWKCQIPRLADFVRDAMGGENGITVPDNGRGFGMLTDTDGINDPELSTDQLNAVAFFLENLAPPARKGSTDPAVAAGEILFAQIGCATCHTPSLQGTTGPVALYSNLLLHNVLPATFRGMSEPGATTGFYRTPPLWGISDTAPYFHDGRAETLLDAIQSHDGEAAGVRAAFNALTANDQTALLAFLTDL